MRTKSLFLFAKGQSKAFTRTKTVYLFEQTLSFPLPLSRSLPFLLLSFLLFPSPPFPLSLSLMVCSGLRRRNEMSSTFLLHFGNPFQSCSGLRRRNDKRSAILLRNGEPLPIVFCPVQEERDAIHIPPALWKPHPVRIRRAHWRLRERTGDREGQTVDRESGRGQREWMGDLGGRRETERVEGDREGRTGD